MGNIVRVSTEVIHDNSRFGRVYKHDVFRKPDGTTGDYFYIESVGGAMIVPLLPSGDVVMVEQYRYLDDRMSLEFPCGGLQDNENSFQAAERELSEETGYRAAMLQKIGEFSSSNGVARDSIHTFIAQGLHKIGDPQNEITGELKIYTFSPHECEKLILAGTIWDGQTLAAWMLVRLFREHNSTIS